MTKKKSIDIEFQIRGIELLDSCLNAPKNQLPNNSVFQFDINLEHRLSIENKLVIVICSVSILSENKDEVLGQIKTSCIFQVSNLDTFLDNNSNDLKFPEEFIITLNSISISTTRGVMFSFFRGTFLHNAVLPMVDPKVFRVNTKN